MPQDKLVVFADDWGRHPSSVQHLVSRLLPQCDVTWVNTIGMRPPRLNMATVRRGLEKFSQWGRRSADRSSLEYEKSPSERDIAAQPRVLNPRMWPSFRGSWQRRLNRKLIGRCLQSNIEQLEDAVVLTTIPIVTDLVGNLPARRWVYYCVDDFSTWPGLDSQTMLDMETPLIANVDSIVAAGENLADRIRKMDRDVEIITHGVDLDHWTTSKTSKALAEFESPVALFWGLVDPRLDLKFLQKLSHRMQRGSIVLMGPQQDPFAELSELSNVHLPGPIDFAELPAAAAAADVLIMPYADLPVTRAMQPLKLKEYLATGKPTVVRRLPAVGDWEDCLDAVDDADCFAETVLQRIAQGVSADQHQNRQRLKQEGWSHKSVALHKVLFG